MTLAAWAAPAAAAAAARPSTGPAAPGSTAAIATSDNWSGYVATGKAYAEAGGTFSVPALSHYLAGSTASEWVGVDGWSNSSLVQAGVNEVPVGRSATLFEPWWEVVPGPQELASGVMVRAGDRVTVQVEEVSPGRWSISLLDDTNGDRFTTVQSYAGPATSAEWVVEADTTASGTPTRLAPLGDKVTFTGATLDDASAAPRPSLERATLLGSPASSPAGSSPGTTTFTKVVMVQGGNATSTPSLLGAGTFSVAYARGPRAGGV